jgi:hypothetical protein
VTVPRREPDARRAAPHHGEAHGVAPRAFLRDFEGLLLAAAVAYSACHHVGSLPGGLGTVGDTRWADWLDVLTPYLVLLPAGAALVVTGASTRRLAAFAAGALLYAQGHGIHLSANSIGNVAPSPVVHLWDEVVGHATWYGGMAVVLGVLATAMRDRPRPAGAAVLAGSAALALAVGGTWVTNALGAGLAVPALAVAAALAWYGVRHRGTLAGLLAVAFGPAVVVLTACLVTGAA